MNRITHLLLLGLLALSAASAPRSTSNILALSESITDSDIVYPESFETDTREMMKNWYLQNYTILDADVENRDYGEVSDEEYVRRLKAMPTVVEMPFNQIVRSHIERYITRNRTLVEEMLGMSLYYMPIFEQALEKEGLPLELKYLPVIESALNPNAVSRAGAAGLWQFMVGTGKGLGLEVNSLVDERRDPYKSSEKAATYLRNLYEIYGDWSLAIAAYNCGPGNVNKALRRAGEAGNDFWAIYPYLPRETRGYVPAFIAANYVMTYFKRHNISASLASKPLITDTVSVARRVNFNQIAAVLNLPVEAIRTLNPQFRHDVIPGTPERPYTIVLPSQQVYSYIMSEDSIAAYRPDLYAQREVVEPGEATAGDEGTYTYETRTVTEYHKVRRGETYSSIAAHYGMDINTLYSLNGLKSGSKARRGQSVKVQTRKKVRVAADEPSDYADIREVRHDADGNELPKPDDSEREREQIEQVHQVEQAALESQQHRTHDRVTAQATQTETKTKTYSPAPAQQSHKRNERYTDGKTHSAGKGREQTYKQSHSSSNRADARARRSSKKEAAKPTEYNVKKGETLSEISEKTGVPVKTLREANGIKDDDKIRAGESLKLQPQTQTKTSKSGKGAKAGKGSGKTASKGSTAKGSGKAAKSTGSKSSKTGAGKSSGSKSKGKKRK